MDSILGGEGQSCAEVAVSLLSVSLWLHGIPIYEGVMGVTIGVNLEPMGRVQSC